MKQDSDLLGEHLIGSDHSAHVEGTPMQSPSRLLAVLIRLQEPKSEQRYVALHVCYSGSGSQLSTYRYTWLSLSWAGVYHFNPTFKADKSLCKVVRLLSLREIASSLMLWDAKSRS